MRSFSSGRERETEIVVANLIASRPNVLLLGREVGHRALEMLLDDVLCAA